MDIIFYLDILLYTLYILFIRLLKFYDFRDKNCTNYFIYYSNVQLLYKSYVITRNIHVLYILYKIKILTNQLYFI